MTSIVTSTRLLFPGLAFAFAADALPQPALPYLPSYVLLWAPVQMASLDSFSSPRWLWPLICGRYAVAGILTDSTNNIFTGVVQDGTPGGGALGIVLDNHDRAWTRLLGTNTWTGPTILTAGSAATIKAPASLAWSIGARALLCIDADQVSDANTAWTAPAGLRITYADGSGVVYVDGPLTVAAGAQISVSAAPPYYPAPLIEAAGGITGTFTAGTMPAGYSLLHTPSIVFISHL